ncbi:MAG: exosortase H [Thermodesulfobacteriota bacterium]
MKKLITRFSESAVLRFIVIYIILMGLFFLVIGLKSFKEVLDINGAYTSSIVFICSVITNMIGIPATYAGSLIKLPSIILDIEFGCNGLEAVMIYAVAVLAYPALWKQKSLGLLAGFFIIQVLNIIRIAALVYTGVHYKNLFDFFHVYIAQGIMIAVSLAVFILYLYYISYLDAKNRPAE